jgi:hypothetical protein
LNSRASVIASAERLYDGVPSLFPSLVSLAIMHDKYDIFMSMLNASLFVSVSSVAFLIIGYLECPIRVRYKGALSSKQ